MKLKNIVPIFAALLIMIGVLSACGEEKKEETSSKTDSQVTTTVSTSEIPKETTVVLETTPDGGTVEKDSEGNKITKAPDGTVIAVEDENGTPVDVEEYVSTHSWVQGSNSGSGTSSQNGSGNSGDSGNSGNSDKSGSSSANGSGSTDKSGSSSQNGSGNSGNSDNTDKSGSSQETQRIPEETKAEGKAGLPIPAAKLLKRRFRSLL